jgi:hypothetical protein
MDSLEAPPVLNLSAGIPQSDAPPDMTAAFGENPWDVQQRQQEKDQADWFRKSQDTLDKAALDPEAFYKDKDLSFARTPQEAYKLATTDAFVSLHYDAPLPPDELSRKLIRAQLADQYFDGRGRDTDEAFHAEIVADATRRKSAKEIHSGLMTDAVTSSIVRTTDPAGDATNPKSFAAWREAASQSPGYDPARQADYYQAWTETRRAADEARAQFQKPLNDVWMSFKAGGADTASVARNAYFEIQPADRPRFMASLKLLAGTLPEQDQKGFWMNLSKSLVRETPSLGNQAANLLFRNMQEEAQRAVAYTPEQQQAKEAIGNIAGKYSEAADFAADIMRIQQQDYDPMQFLSPDSEDVMSWRTLEKGIYSAPGAVVSTLIAATPGIGMPAFYAMSKEGIYQDMRQKFQSSGMDYETARTRADDIAGVAAVPQMLMEKLQLGILAGKLPITEKILGTLSDKIANRALRFGVRTVAGAADEAFLETSQDLLPSAIQYIAGALQTDIPDVKWQGEGGILESYWADNASMFVTMLPLAIVGAAGGMNADARVKAFANATDNELKALGIPEADVLKIREGSTKGLASGLAAIESAFSRLDPKSESARAAVQALTEDAALQEEAMRSGVLPTLSRNASGWTVSDGETGETIGTAPTSDEAWKLAKTHSAAMDDLDADRVAYMASMMQSADAVAKLDQGGNETTTTLNLRTAMTETIAAAEDPAQATRFAEQVALKERMNGGTGAITYGILGKSSTEIRDGLRQTINQLYAGSSVTDVFHEAFHGFRREAHAAGRITRADDIAVLRALDTVLAGKVTRPTTSGRTEQLRFLPEGITDDQITATMLDEAISHVGEMEVLRSRTDRSGKKQMVPSGIVTRNLTAIGKLVGSKVANNFKAFMDAIRAHFGLSMSRALALKKAEREGKFDATTLDSYLAKLLGTTEQDQFNQDVSQQAADLLGTDYSGENMDTIGEGDPFSIGRTTIFPTSGTRSIDTTDGRTLTGPAAFSIKAFHGTPHKVDKFRLDKIGTGEGAQAYGWGLYFAEAQAVGEEYRKGLSSYVAVDGKPIHRNNRNVGTTGDSGLDDLLIANMGDLDAAIKDAQDGLEEYVPKLEALRGRVDVSTNGNLYTVTLDVNDEDLLDWDKPLSEQPEKVRAALQEALDLYKETNPLDFKNYLSGDPSGANIIRFLPSGGTSLETTPQQVTKDLQILGIPGIRFLDGNSRDSGTGSYNYVIFDESKIKITEENGKPVDPNDGPSFSIAKSGFNLLNSGIDTNSPGGANIGDGAQPGNSAVTLTEAVSLFSKGEMKLSVVGVRSGDIPSSGKSFNQISQTLEKGVSTADILGFGDGKGYLDNQRPVVYLRGTVLAELGGDSEFLLRNPVPISKQDYETSLSDPKSAIAKAILSKWRANELTKLEKDGWKLGQQPAIWRSRAIEFASSFNQSPPAASGEASFSLAPSERNAQLMGDALARVKDPIRRAQAMAKISKNFNELRLAAERVELIAGSKRLRKSLQKEAAMREAQRADELERDAYARHSGILSTNDLTTLKSRPLHELLSVPKRDGTVDHLHGRLMSKAAAMKQQPDLFRETSYGGYDGADGVSPTVYGGKLLPSEAAQEAYNANLIPEPTPDALWEELKKEQASVAAMKEAMAKAEADIKAARTMAREETNAWLKTQTETLATAYSPKQEILRALASLDAILTAIPADVRGRIGGYTALASLGSEETRLAFLKEKLAKADKELEGWMRRQYDAEFRKLLDQARPLKKEAGEKPRGKVGADVHDLFRAVEDSMTFSAQEVEAEVERLDNLANHVNTTPEQQAHLLQEAGLIALAGNWGKADAARREAALLEANRIFSTGYANFQRLLSAKREDRAKSRDALRLDTGKAGERMERLTQEIKDSKTKIGRAKQTLLSLYSFEQVLHKAFGPESKVGQMLADWERRASIAKHDAIQSKMDALDELFADLAQGKFKGEQLRYDLSEPGTVSVVDFKGRTQTFSQLEAISATLMWRQEDGKRHMEGHFNEETNTPNGDWHWRQQDIDAIEKQLSSTAQAVRLHLIEEYATEYDRLNAVFQSLYGVNLPRHKFYSPLTVAPQAAASGQTLDPVTGSTMSGASLTPGSLRTRSQTAVAEPRFTDALQTFIAHTKQMEHWMAYTPFATEAMNLLNNREVGNSIEASAGKEAKNVLRGWIDYFAQGGVRDAQAHLAINGWFARALGRASQAALVGRFSVLGIQSLQLGAGAYQMPVGAFALRFGKLLTGQLGWKAAIQSDYIQRRLSEMPPIVRQSLEGLTSSKPSRLKYLTRKLGSTINGADALFTAGTYAILYDYHLTEATRNRMTGKAAETFAHDEAVRATDRVAQPTRPGERSLYELTATSPSARLIWAFASEARQKAAITAFALSEKPWDQKLKAIAITWGVGGAMAALIRTIMRDMRDDGDELFDERNWDPRRLALQTLTGPLQGIPILGKEIEASINAGFGQWQTDGSLLSTGRQLAQRAPKMDDDLTSGNVDAIIKDVELLLTFGAPGSDSIAATASWAHVVRDLIALLKNASD